MKSMDLLKRTSAVSYGNSKESMVVRFAGDSGDGIQLAGGEFSLASAIDGDDISTFPDYPAEIRAPAGTTYGVSAFQVRFGRVEIETSGDAPDILVAFNPAALKVNAANMRPDALAIVDSDTFTERNLARGGWSHSPLDEPTTSMFRLVPIPITTRTRQALASFEVGNREVLRARNLWTLGLMLWLFGRDVEKIAARISARFGNRPALAAANLAALRAGHAFGETAELAFIPRLAADHGPQLAPGRYRTITGSEGIAYGLVAGAQAAGLDLVFASYPITPASPILHELARLGDFGVKTIQAEDEIAAICIALGAAYAGALGCTSSSGPGLALKSEALGLAVAAELPLVVVNSQRGGPSTGLPTKAEQSDLFQAIFGRNGECPLPVIAARTPADCFDATMEACRIAIHYMTPVILLSDGAIANAAEPWRLPEPDSLPRAPARFLSEPPEDGQRFNPYQRDPTTLARPWVRPGTAGLEHRIGGLEKSADTGDISYSPLNHQCMTDLRARKIANTANDMGVGDVLSGDPHGDLLVIGWGSTYGAIAEAVRNRRRKGLSISHLHLRHLNPMPPQLDATAAGFRSILVPELNSGQLALLLEAKLKRPVTRRSKVTGEPFRIEEIEFAIDECLDRSGAS